MIPVHEKYVDLCMDLWIVNKPWGLSADMLVSLYNPSQSTWNLT